MSVESLFKSWESFSPEIQTQLREFLERDPEPPPPIHPDSATLRHLIRIYELLEGRSERVIQINADAEMAGNVLGMLDGKIAKALDEYQPWPDRFQGIADRLYPGAKLDALTLRKMRGRIHQDHPEMTAADVNNLLLPDAFRLLTDAANASGNQAPPPRENEQPAAAPASGTVTPEAPAELPDLVRLDQAAAAVHVSKRTLERCKTQGTLPEPTVEGGGGRPALYDWKIMRPWLTKKFGVILPERYFGH
jgi:hypothetical protein